MFNRKLKRRIAQLEEAVIVPNTGSDPWPHGNYEDSVGLTGRPGKNTVILNKKIRELEALARRLVLDPPTVRVTNDGDDGTWIARVGGRTFSKGDYEEEMEVRVDGIPHHTERVIRFCGYDTAAQAEKAAKEYLENLPAVRVTSA